MMTIECLSFKKLIATYDKEDIFFCSYPPYVGTENYYRDTSRFGFKEHEKLAEVLKIL